MNKDTHANSFRERLRAARKDLGLTQKQLAELTGLSRRSIVHYENHGNHPPLDVLIQLARVLSTSIDYLVGFTPSATKKDQILSYSLMKRFRVISQLPLRDQRKIFKLINELAEKHGLK